MEEVDARVWEAFYRCLLESVKDTDLPMETSDFMKNHMSEYSCDEFKLDLRKSSFKKIGKLLQAADKAELIEYSIPAMMKRTEKLVTRIFRQHPKLLGFQP